jgi:4-amino-4-deoxy-L-arabinose transferase-like glycosyltransferase
MTRDRTLNGVDIVILVAALMLLTFGIGNYGLFEPHEGHFADVAREMLLREDWITPTLNGAHYLNKPPLLYWMIATSCQLFGINEFAARLPVALSGWLGVIVAWTWCRDLWGALASRSVALMLSSTVGWFIFAHQILIDELLGALILAMLYCLWRLVWQPTSQWYFGGLYLLLGLSLLAKGLLGLVFFVAGLTAIALSRRSFKVLRQLRPGLGSSITLAMTLPWFIAVEQANPGFLQYLIVNEHFQRIFDRRWPPDYTVSKISPWGYLVVSALWCLPWALLLPQAIVSAFQEWQQGQDQAAPLEDRRRSEGLLLLAIAAALPILLFLPMSSRLYYYSVPAIAPLIIFCAGWWSGGQNLSRQPGRQTRGMLFCVLGLAIATSVFWAPHALINTFPELPSTSDISSALVVILLSSGLGLLAGGILMLINRPTLALVGLFLGLAIAWAGMVHGFSLSQDFRSSKTLIETAEPRLGLATLWTFEGSRELGAAGAMSYYLDRQGHHSLAEISANAASMKALPAGWAEGSSETAYRVVQVLTDGGPNRLPPKFPGEPPRNWITQKQLQAYWDSSRPVVFVTDFLRKPNDPTDPANLNLPLGAGEPLLVIQPRKLYGNAAARNLWLK